MFVLKGMSVYNGENYDEPVELMKQPLDFSEANFKINAGRMGETKPTDITKKKAIPVLVPSRYFKSISLCIRIVWEMS